MGPLSQVTVNARPAELVRIGGPPREAGGVLQAQLPDGRTFVVQAPGAFTKEQVFASRAR